MLGGGVIWVLLAMGNRCDARPTPVTSAQMLEAVGQAWIARTGDTPARATVDLLLAQSALETGRWHSLMGYNVGNLKASSTAAEYDYCYFTTREYVAGKWETFYPDDPVTRFRWYATLADGCADYLGLLQTRYAFAWDRVIAGDVDGFVHALKTNGYFTAPEAAYDSSVRSLAREFASLPAACWELPDTEPEVVAGD